MSVSVKDLRTRTREIVQSLKRGEKPLLTYRGHPLAQIIPLSDSRKKSFRDVGYGMWRDHSGMKEVSSWLDNQRKPRFAR